MTEHRIDVAAPPGQALAAVGEAADHWGALWEPSGRGGRLSLPVVRGLRRGLVRGRVSVASRDAGSSLSFAVEESRHSVNRPAAAVLLLGALGGLVVALWPFFPPLVALLPVATVLALVAWLLVVSRLRSSGPADFLELVASICHGPPEPPPGREPEEPPPPVAP